MTYIKKTNPKYIKAHTFKDIRSLNMTKHLILLDGYGVKSIKFLDNGLFELQVS